MGNLIRGRRTVVGSLALLVAMSGCDQISINPACPETMGVGDSAQVLAQQFNPGAIATYRWTVSPSGAGSVSNATSPNATFTATAQGTATLRLVANDGLFEVTDTCTIEVAGAAELAVALSAQPARPSVGETVTLTCRGIGTEPISQFVITSIAPTIVELTETGPGVTEFTPAESGEFNFRCQGSDANGNLSRRSDVMVNVGP